MVMVSSRLQLAWCSGGGGFKAKPILEWKKSHLSSQSGH